MQTEEGSFFNITSLYGAATRKPLVSIAVVGKDFQINLTPQEAMQIASQLLEVAAAAETDAFLVEFITKKIGKTDDHLIARLLLDFRAFREKHERQNRQESESR